MDIKTLRTKYRALSPGLTERSKRLWAASEATALGHGGIALVERATGISRSTISHGIREVEPGAHEALGPERTWRPGGGRKRAVEKDATLVADLESLVEPTTSGDPEALLVRVAERKERTGSRLSADRILALRVADRR